MHNSRCSVKTASRTSYRSSIRGLVIQDILQDVSDLCFAALHGYRSFVLLLFPGRKLCGRYDFHDARSRRTAQNSSQLSSLAAGSAPPRPEKALVSRLIMPRAGDEAAMLRGTC